MACSAWKLAFKKSKSNGKYGEHDWWLTKGPPTVRCTEVEEQTSSSSSQTSSQTSSPPPQGGGGKKCMIRVPDGRDLPETMCPLSKGRIMMLSFFTVSPHGQLWKSAGSKDHIGVQNRHCFAATRKYVYVVEVVNDSDMKVRRRWNGSN